MNYLLVYILILRFPIHFADKTNVPVLLMDSENVTNDIHVQSNPFVKMNSAQFTNILFETKSRSEAIIIFVEDNLSVEDLSSKDKFGTPYKHMHEALKANQVKYFPGVADPYKLLKHIFEPISYNVYYMSSGTDLKIIDKSFKYIYVYFEDGMNSTRAESLRQHDIIIHEVNSAVRNLKPGRIVSFYTGKNNPVEVKKLELIPLKSIDDIRDVSVLVLTKRAMFRFIGVYSATATRRANFDQAPLVGKETWSRTRLSTKMAYTDFELEFDFGFEEKEWKLDSVALLEGGEEVGRTRMSVSVPWGFSYLCGEPLVIVNRRDNSFVSVSQYQIQPRSRRQLRDEVGDPEDPTTPPVPDDPTTPPPDETTTAPPDPPAPGAPGAGDGAATGSSSDECFDTAINCGPYFNTNILATLFVTFICLGIAMSGILVLMSCNANANYDDPQGKPLVIASEPTAS